MSFQTISSINYGFINYRLIWEKILKCKGEQINLKTELKLPNNLFYLY
jgi:hypothetical protein